jgi:hypothetical protein
MSEVDRLSNSGLYPALPIADQRNRRNPGQSTPEKRPQDSTPEAAAEQESKQPRPPKSLIDEYA